MFTSCLPSNNATPIPNDNHNQNNHNPPIISYKEGIN